MAMLTDGAAFVGGTSMVSLLRRLDDGVSKSYWCWIRSSTSRLDQEGGYVRLEERAGGMDHGGASSDDGRGKQGQCCIRLDYKVVLVVVVVGIGGISQFY
jgi:hypothetical protein